MADITATPDLTTQAYDIAQQNAADARGKTGQYVKGDAYKLAGISAAAAASIAPADTLGATAPTSQLAQTVNADAPILPDPSGATAKPADVMRVVKGSDVFKAGGDGVFAALQAASDARQTDTNAAMLVKRGQAAIQLTAKQQEFADKAKEIHGMEVSSMTKLASSLAGLGLSWKLTSMGNRSAQTTGGQAAGEDKRLSDKIEANNVMYRNLGQNVTGSVDAVHNILDVNAGGQAEQNSAQLAQKQDAIQAQVAQTNVDSSGAWLDDAKEKRKAAQQAIQTHVQMVGEAISNVWK